MRTPAKTPEQRIAESRATLAAIFTAWVALLFVLSIIPLFALSLWLAGQWWE